MATNLFRGSCTPNLGGVQDYYTKAEINQLLSQRGVIGGLFLETNHVWVGNLSDVQSQYELDPNYYAIDHATGAVSNLSADRLRTARTLTLTGAVTGTTTSNLATGFTINTTVATGSITGAMIATGTITDTNIGLAAEIAVSKLADGAPRQLLETAADGITVQWASNIDVPGTLDVTGNAVFDANVNITGNLTVSGTQTALDVDTLRVEDRNIELGKVVTPTDITADGGGITLLGDTSKTIIWERATASWSLSEHLNLALGRSFRINNIQVLSATALGSSVQISTDNIPAGTITNDDLAGAIADTKLNTIITANKVAISALDIDGGIDIGAALADTDLFVVDDGGGGTNRKAVATRITDYTFGKVSGDITITNTGTAAITAGVIINGDINASAAISFSKLASLPSANVLVGNVSNVATSVSVTGDITISNTGVTAIASGVIVDGDISPTAEIAVSKLADGTPRQLLETAADGVTVQWTDNIDVPGTLDVTGNAVFDSRVTINGADITESARDIEESRLIRRNATVSIGTPGMVPFGVGPIIPPGMSLVGIGPDSYNIIDTLSGSVC